MKILTKLRIKQLLLACIFSSCYFSIPTACLALLNLQTPISLPNPEKVFSKQDMNRLTMAITYIEKYYVKPIDKETLVNNAISGMLAKLDPHSDYLDESELKSLEMVTVGQFGGIGVEVIPDQGAIRVVTPLDDTPADKAGIKAGDIIIQINHELVRDMTLRDALNMMRGPIGSKVVLTIIRKNQTKPLYFTLTRQTIKVQSIKDKMLEPGFAYIRISFFQESTEKDLVRVINKIMKANHDNLKGIVLDLRNNPGGLLESAIQVADDFLDASKFKNNKIIVYTEGKFDGSRITANATDGEWLPGVPIVVLINEGSASAAEIVAGALQEHHRAIVVGMRSFGKGSVQTLLPLDNKSAIKLTTALYYTPLGHSIQARGIQPDIVINEIELPKSKSDAANFLEINESKLMDHLENNDSLAKSKKIEGKNPIKADVEEQKLLLQRERQEQKDSEKSLSLARSDFQLYEALTILKGLNAASISGD
jgi:carboxyl-terminal processing protease